MIEKTHFLSFRAYKRLISTFFYLLPFKHLKLSLRGLSYKYGNFLKLYSLRFKRKKNSNWILRVSLLRNSQYLQDSSNKLSVTHIHPAEELCKPHTHWVNFGTFHVFPLPSYENPSSIFWVHCWVQAAHRRKPPYSVYIHSGILSSTKELWNTLEHKLLPHLNSIDDPLNHTLPLYLLNHPVLLDIWAQQEVFAAQEWDRISPASSSKKRPYWTYFQTPIQQKFASDESNLKNISIIKEKKVFQIKTTKKSLFYHLYLPLFHWFQLHSSNLLWFEQQIQHLHAAKELSALHLWSQLQNTPIPNSSPLGLEREGSLSHPQFSPSLKSPNTPWETSLHNSLPTPLLTLSKPHDQIPCLSWSLSSSFWQPYNLSLENTPALNFSSRDEFLHFHVYPGTLAGKYRYPIGYPLEQEWTSEDPEELFQDIPILPTWRWAPLESRKPILPYNLKKLIHPVKRLISINSDLNRRAHLYFPNKEIYLHFLLSINKTLEPIIFNSFETIQFIRTTNLIDDPIHSLYNWILLQHQTLTEKIWKNRENSWIEFQVPSWTYISYKLSDLIKIKEILEIQQIKTWASFYKNKIISREYKKIQSWHKNNLNEIETKSLLWNKNFQIETLIQQLSLYKSSYNLKQLTYNWEKSLPYLIYNTFFWTQFDTPYDNTLNKKIVNLTDKKIIEWQNGVDWKGSLLTREQTPSSRFPIFLKEVSLENRSLDMDLLSESNFNFQRTSIQRWLKKATWQEAINLLQYPATEIKDIKILNYKEKIQEPDWLYLFDTSTDLQNISYFLPLNDKKEKEYREWLKRIPLAESKQRMNLPVPITYSLFKNWESNYKKWHKCLHPEHPLKSYINAPQFESPTMIQEIFDRLQYMDLPWTVSTIQGIENKDNKSEWKEQPFHPNINLEKNLIALKEWCEQAVLLITISMATTEITLTQRHQNSLWGSNTLAQFLQRGGADNST